jgi:hypothetical protein
MAYKNIPQPKINPKSRQNIDNILQFSNIAKRFNGFLAGCAGLPLNNHTTSPLTPN